MKSKRITNIIFAVITIAIAVWFIACWHEVATNNMNTDYVYHTWNVFTWTKSAG